MDAISQHTTEQAPHDRTQGDTRDGKPAADAERVVVLGVDNSPAGLLALDWAVAEAIARHETLRLVRVWSTPVEEPWYFADERAERLREHDSAHHVAERFAERVAAQHPELPVQLRITGGDPIDALRKLAADASVLVVGTHRGQAVRAALEGSVSYPLAARAGCPVIVVPPATGAEPPFGMMAGVVAGVSADGSAEDVLGFAFDFAERHHLPLWCVTCWRPDLLAVPPAGKVSIEQQQAELSLSEALAGWRERYPDVTVRTTVLCAHASDGLVDSAAGARLLVVGRRSWHSRLGVLLGSVSQRVVRHATCPVAIVPPAG